MWRTLELAKLGNVTQLDEHNGRIELNSTHLAINMIKNELLLSLEYRGVPAGSQGSRSCTGNNIHVYLSKNIQ